MSTRSLIISALKRKEFATATELAKDTNTKLSSTSSLLKKMFDEGTINRIDGMGPRGGNVYWLCANYDKSPWREYWPLEDVKEAIVHYYARKRIKDMSVDQKRQTFIDSGIINSNGKLTKKYGGK